MTLANVSAADGTSQTLFIGEQSGVSDGSGSFSPTVDFNYIGGGGAPTFSGALGLPRGRMYQFSSAHPGIVQFAFGDGSVRPFSPGQTATIGGADWYLLQQLAGYKETCGAARRRLNKSFGATLERIGSMKRRHLLVATVGGILAAMIGCNTSPPSSQPAYIPKSKKFGRRD